MEESKKPTFDEIDRLISNPFYSDSGCPFKRKYKQTSECARGVSMALKYLSKEEQYQILKDIIPKIFMIVCPICRVKAYIVGRKLCQSCCPDFEDLFFAAMYDVSLDKRRPLEEIMHEMDHYFDKPV